MTTNKSGKYVAKAVIRHDFPVMNGPQERSEWYVLDAMISSPGVCWWFVDKFTGEEIGQLTKVTDEERISLEVEMSLGVIPSIIDRVNDRLRMYIMRIISIEYFHAHEMFGRTEDEKIDGRPR